MLEIIVWWHTLPYLKKLALGWVGSLAFFLIAGGFVALSK